MIPVFTSLMLTGGILAAPVLFVLIHNLTNKGCNPMAVSPELQAQFDRISAEIATLKAVVPADPAVQAAHDAANAQIAQLQQDAADALAAAQAVG